ncbi:MAG: peptide-methionine (R)-S-oxide reductase [Deltaproteobacteria bacterium]|jgi:peptide-methionine (R)-S-oxide reductase|nr:peptide-methionine (R)-S-oxide reductase [Deltaproteobacteria bacterium]
MANDESTPAGDVEKVTRSEDEWRDQLTDEAYQVARCSATERAFTGRYWNEKAAGTYHCVCCDAPLFRSETKYDSGSGWPSFFQPIDENAVGDKVDETRGMVRTESVCARCDAHLGHVFPDGPRPTGLRYCMNSASLNLKKDGE